MDDSSYDNLFIINRYKKSLKSGLGNLVSRLIRGRGWDVRRAVKKSDKFIGQLDKDLSSELTKIQYELFWCMKQPAPREGLHKIMEIVYQVCDEYPSLMCQTDPLDECIHATQCAVGACRAWTARATRPHHLPLRGFASDLRYFAPTIYANQDEAASGHAGRGRGCANVCKCKHRNGQGLWRVQG